MFMRRSVVLLVLAISVVAVSVAANIPWDKPPEKWTLDDVFHILQDSPWSPSKFSIESNYSQRTTDSQTNVVGDSHVNGRNTAVVPSILLFAKPSSAADHCAVVVFENHSHGGG
jgi:hypothetical protein